MALSECQHPPYISCSYIEVCVNIERLDYYLKAILFSPSVEPQSFDLISYLQLSENLLNDLITLKSDVESNLSADDYTRLLKIISNLIRIIKEKKDLSGKVKHSVEILQESSLSNKNNNDVIKNKEIISAINISSIEKESRNDIELMNESHDSSGNDNRDSAKRIQSLMLQQKNIAAVEIDEEIRYHEMMTAELAELTHTLKENTMNMSETLTLQNLALSGIQQHASDNFTELSRQQKQMNERGSDVAGDIWTTTGSILWVVISFILAYVIIRLFPKPT